jgi:hypothetical protein
LPTSRRTSPDCVCQIKSHINSRMSAGV